MPTRYVAVRVPVTGRGSAGRLTRRSDLGKNRLGTSGMSHLERENQKVRLEEAF